MLDSIHNCYLIPYDCISYYPPIKTTSIRFAEYNLLNFIDKIGISLLFYTITYDKSINTPPRLLHAFTHYLRFNCSNWNSHSLCQISFHIGNEPTANPRNEESSISWTILHSSELIMPARVCGAFWLHLPDPVVIIFINVDRQLRFNCHKSDPPKPRCNWSFCVDCWTLKKLNGLRNDVLPAIAVPLQPLASDFRLVAARYCDIIWISVKCNLSLTPFCCYLSPGTSCTANTVKVILGQGFWNFRFWNHFKDINGGRTNWVFVMDRVDPDTHDIPTIIWDIVANQISSTIKKLLRFLFLFWACDFISYYRRTIFLRSSIDCSFLYGQLYFTNLKINLVQHNITTCAPLPHHCHERISLPVTEMRGWIRSSQNSSLDI